MHASHETIYAHPKGELRKALINYLRQGRRSRRARFAGEDGRVQLPETFSSHVRRPEVNDRTLAGHWEGALSKAP